MAAAGTEAAHLRSQLHMLTQKPPSCSSATQTDRSSAPPSCPDNHDSSSGLATRECPQCGAVEPGLGSRQDSVKGRAGLSSDADCQTHAWLDQKLNAALGRVDWLQEELNAAENRPCRACSVHERQIAQVLQSLQRKVSSAFLLVIA